MRQVIYEHFKSLNQLLDTMDERPLNEVFKKELLSSQRDESENRRKFSGVNTYKEAIEIMEKGYNEPLEKMKRAILKIGRNDDYKKAKMKADFVGFVPHVPNAINNIPLTMINKERTRKKAKTIHLTYSFCALGGVSTDEIINGGINFISLVNSLEKQGFRVKIDTIFISISNGTASIYTVTLKDYGQALNLLKLAFPLVHPAMLRRISFKWLETTPELKEKGYRGGYGTTLGFTVSNNLEKEIKWLKEHGLFKNENSYYVNVYEAIKAKNIQELAQKMGLSI